MDVERTMDFIVQQQAAMTVRQERMDRRMDGISKLVKIGMRMLVKIGEAQKVNARQIRELTRIQKKNEERFARMDTKFDRMLAALLRRSSNGRG